LPPPAFSLWELAATARVLVLVIEATRRTTGWILPIVCVAFLLYAYYGGFLLDPDGNSVEALTGERELRVPSGRIDHLWIRVRDLAASKRFYTTIAPHAGLRIGTDEPERVHVLGENFSFALVDDGRPLTEPFHLAFSAHEDAAVRAFHAAALAAGYEDNGGPGERVVYHPGYYGAFVLDPDGHNVEVVNHNR